MASVPTFTPLDYTKFFTAGAVCCLGTHGGVTPIDVVKTRIQLRPELKGLSMLAVGRDIVAKEGSGALLTGFGSTAFGYFLQGGAKFAGYEFWKRKLVQAAGGPEAAVEHRTAIYLTGAAIAEFFADILLAPCEATRIRLVSDSKYATGFFPAMARMAREGGVGEFYQGFVPLLFKQVPYALGQFTVNEWAHEAVTNYFGEEKVKEFGPVASSVNTLGCGVVAGVAASLLSQPADTMLSRINKGEGGKGSNLSKLANIARDAGFRGLFAGTGPRLVMTCFLVSGQFGIYGAVKKAVGAPQGVEIHSVA